MRKGKDVTGLPVFTFDTGEKIGEVKDLLFDPEQHKLLALLIDEGGWFKEARTIPFSSIKSIGPDAVIVPSANVVVEAKTDPEIARAMDSDRVVLGNRVLTESGEDLGEIHDIAFDENTGRIEGYAVSGGFFADKFKGKPFVPAPDTMRVGKEVVYVPDETAKKMEEQVGGVAGAVKATGESTQGRLAEVTGTAGDKATELAETVRQRAGELSSQMSTITTEQQKKYVVGKTAKSDVRTDNLDLIAAKGDNVTPEAAERADQEGKLGALVAAVGAGELAESARTMKEQAQGLFQSVKEKVGTATTQFQEQQLDSAKGKKATRVVQADDKTLIVAADQVVTDDVIEMAKRHDKVNELLAAVNLGRAQEMHDTALRRTLEIFGEAPRSTEEAERREEPAVTGATARGAAPRETAESQQPEVLEPAQEPVIAQTGTEPTPTVQKPYGLEPATAVHETVAEERKTSRLEKGDVEELVGKTASQPVADNHGNVILQAGETVTQETVERAWEADKLDELRMVVLVVVPDETESAHVQ